MNGKVPHIVQYQGSKRILAPQILRYMPKKFNRLIEPFAGMAAITIATAMEHRADCYLINDLNEPLVELLSKAINSPQSLIENYSHIWNEQFEYEGGHIDHFYHIRELYNEGNHSPEIMLYLLARCVKGAVRYGRDGKFNQSPDKRRHGTNPKNIANSVNDVSLLLKGKTTFSALDYKTILESARPGDLVYMDPPYQGVSNTRDNRYLAGVEFDEFAKSIEILNHNEVDYIISYDGACGGKVYGEDLPTSLSCTKLLLNAGLSSQATLLGKRDTTYEALYLSSSLSNVIDKIPALPTQLDFWEVAI
jgi:DNA adenine methylase